MEVASQCTLGANGSRTDGTEADESETGDSTQMATGTEHAGDDSPHSSCNESDSVDGDRNEIRRDLGPPEVQPGHQTIDGNVGSDDRAEDNDVPTRQQLFEVVTKHMTDTAARFDQMQHLNAARFDQVQQQIMAMMAIMQQKAESDSGVSPPRIPVPTMSRSVDLEGVDANEESSPGSVDVSKFDLTKRMTEDDLDTKARRQSIMAQVEDVNLLIQRIPEVYTRADGSDSMLSLRPKEVPTSPSMAVYQLLQAVNGKLMPSYHYDSADKALRYRTEDFSKRLENLLADRRRQHPKEHKHTFPSRLLIDAVIQLALKIGMNNPVFIGFVFGEVSQKLRYRWHGVLEARLADADGHFNIIDIWNSAAYKIAETEKHDTRLRRAVQNYNPVDNVLAPEYVNTFFMKLMEYLKKSIDKLKARRFAVQALDFLVDNASMGFKLALRDAKDEPTRPSTISTDGMAEEQYVQDLHTWCVREARRHEENKDMWTTLYGFRGTATKNKGDTPTSSGASKASQHHDPSRGKSRRNNLKKKTERRGDDAKYTDTNRKCPRAKCPLNLRGEQHNNGSKPECSYFCRRSNCPKSGTEHRYVPQSRIAPGETPCPGH